MACWAVQWATTLRHHYPDEPAPELAEYREALLFARWLALRGYLSEWPEVREEARRASQEPETATVRGR